METIQRTINIEPRKQYRPLYERPAIINDLHGGRGRGGSHGATEFALFCLTSPSYWRIAFVRQIRKDVRGSLWQDFKDRVTEARDNGSELPEEELRIADHEMEADYYPTGNIIRCFGVRAEGSRTAKLKSLAGYNLVIIEECDELTEDDFNKLDDSLRTKKGECEPMIIRVFNPPGRLHWIWKFYNLTESKVPGYWKATPKQGVNLLSIHGTYRGNIKNIAPSKVEKWEGYKSGDPEYYYTMIRGLISEGQRGRIFTNWKPISQQQYNDIDARPIMALDFGMMALVEAKIVKGKGYARQLVYSRVGLKELAIEMCLLGITGSHLIIADSEDPISINKLRTGWQKDELTEKEIEIYPQLLKGFYVLGAIKGPGSVDYGIRIVKEMEWYITEDSEDLWNEYREYKWALDKDKNPTNTPDDKTPHHLLDDIRYLATARGRLF